MHTKYQDYFHFEKLCGELFKKLGFETHHDKRYIKSRTTVSIYDLFLKKDNFKIIAEIKFYKTSKPRRQHLIRAVEQLNRYHTELEANKKLLILGNNIDERLKDDIKRENDVEILDLGNLLYLFKPYENLNNEFLTFINNKIIIEEEIKEIKPNVSFLNVKTPNKLNQKVKKKKEKCSCQELLDIPKSKGTIYEKKCTEILKCIFDKDLSRWFEQENTDDDLSRYDLVCRVNKQDNAFWNLIIDEFKSRYIIFEFKNYKEKIKQTQIYTTEKYLFQKALRNVAFIISRKGADNNAIKVTKGILRETGKLIINLTDDDLCEMLKMRQSGDEPSDYLFEKVDNFLLKMDK